MIPGWLEIMAILLLGQVPSEVPLLAHETDYLRVLAEAYQHNREAFSFLSCRFHLIRGQARNEAEARQGKLQPAPLVQEGQWLVHGDKVKYTLLCHSEIPVLERKPQKDGTEIVVLAAGTYSFLTNGQYALTGTPHVGIANIYPPEVPHPGVHFTPFDMGVMGDDERSSPSRTIEKCLQKRYFCRYEGRQRVGTVFAAVVSALPCAKPGPGSLQLRYAFDPQRGFLPVCIECRRPLTGELLSRLWVTEVRKCSGGRWFPWRSVLYDYQPLSSSPYNVRIIEVVELEVDRPPADEEFYLDLDAGTTIYAPTTEGPGDTQFTLPVATRVGLGDLERVWRRCLLQESRGGLELLEERGWPRLAILIVVTLAALVTAILGLALRLRRSGIR